MRLCGYFADQFNPNKNLLKVLQQGFMTFYKLHSRIIYATTQNLTMFFISACSSGRCKTFKPKLIVYTKSCVPPEVQPNLFIVQGQVNDTQFCLRKQRQQLRSITRLEVFKLEARADGRSNQTPSTRATVDTSRCKPSVPLNYVSNVLTSKDIVSQYGLNNMTRHVVVQFENFDGISHVEVPHFVGQQEVVQIGWRTLVDQIVDVCSGSPVAYFCNYLFCAAIGLNKIASLVSSLRRQSQLVLYLFEGVFYKSYTIV